MSIKYKVHVPKAYDLGKKEVQVYVNKMTNWQRNQWARAGRSTTKEELENYTTLIRGLRDGEKTEEG